MTLMFHWFIKFMQLLLVTSVAIISLVYAKSSVHNALHNSITKENVFVTFYSPKCKYSQDFMRTWKKINIEKLPTNGDALSSFWINCLDETDLCIEQKVKFYPSIRFYHTKSEHPIIFRGRRTATQLLSFISKAMLGAPEKFRYGESNLEAKSPEMVNGVMVLTNENFDSLTAGEPLFIKFYTDWCPHCKQLKPVFPLLVDSAKIIGISLGTVNCEAQSELCSKQGIQHYPLLALYASGRQLAVFEGENSVDEWMSFLRKQLNAWTTVKQVTELDGLVPNWYQLLKPISLTLSSFDSAIKATEFLFVKFFAPWCSHCQRLAPVWDRLAQELSQEFPDSKLAVAKVDCTVESSLCNQFAVHGYPTLLMLRWGKRVDAFKGMRDVPGLAAFSRAAVQLHGREDL